MRNKLNPGGAEIGPGKGWADWRKRRDRAIIKPRKNVGARKMAKLEAKRAATQASDSCE
jgi:hypothetical protein